MVHGNGVTLCRFELMLLTGAIEDSSIAEAVEVAAEAAITGVPYRAGTNMYLAECGRRNSES
ncbi:MAG: hypothetical protein PT944_04805 [Actinomycetaceae bacterium]|nr:hypothetical protein [Arcanobacterium sp.]MDD7687219.1 hypothetical protein [Actinomycetaceae bacterium]MDY5273484.1 hypothetical protein [Arcanobacterium sp.]